MSSRFFTALLIACLSASVWSDFGDQALDWTEKDAQIFRDYAIRQLNSKNSIKNNYWAHYWLTQKVQQFQIGDLRIAQAPQPLLINNSNINAFALPGNLIGIHTGLWRFARTEDEFLSVLAHEMGHISLDHFARLSSDQDKNGWIIASGIILSILLANENPQAANATLLSSFAAANQQNLSFSRAMELEADQFAQDILKKNNYNTQAGRHFFIRLDQQTFANTQTEFLSSHPLGSTRSAKLTSEPENIKQNTDPSEFDLINLLVLNHDQNQTSEFLQKWLEAENDEDALPNYSIANNPHFEYALSLFRFKQSESNELLLADLITISERHPQFYPGWLKALEVSLKINQELTCEIWQDLPKEIFQTPISLDGLESIRQASLVCQPTSATQWQATYYWQSGQEEQALSLLRSAIGKELSTNQLARLKEQLNKLNEYYARLR